MEPVNKKVILIAIIMAIFTSFLIYIYIKNSTKAPDNIEYSTVFIAAKTLPAKYKITESDIKTVKVPKADLHKNTIQNKSEVIGKRLKDRIIEGEQILKDRFEEDNNLALAFNIPEGKRAVSININEQIAVSNLIRPGDYVDVIVSFDKEEIQEGQIKITNPQVSKVIIQNVEVLSLGQLQSISEEMLKEPPKTLTLAVSPLDAEKLTYATEFGLVRIALRATDDNKIIDTQGILRSDLVSDRRTTKSTSGSTTLPAK